MAKLAKLPTPEFRQMVEQIKRDLSILDVAMEGGIDLKAEGSRYKGLCPFHDDAKTESFAIDPDKGKWQCYGACSKGGDVISLYQELHGLSFGEAFRELAGRLGLASAAETSKVTKPATKKRDTERYETPPPTKEAVDVDDLENLWPYDRAAAVYVYPILGGGEAHEVRYLKGEKKRSALTRVSEIGLIYGLSKGEYYRKGTCWRQANDKTPRDAELRYLSEARVGLYRPRVFGRARKGEEWVFLVEGPKDAEAGIGIGLYATTSINGASGLRDYQAEELRGHLVAVVGDHDEAGAKGAERRAKLASQVAREVRVLPPLGGEPGSGYDLADFVDAKRRAGARDEEIGEALLELVRNARPQRKKVEIEVTTHEKEVNDAALETVAREEENLYQRFGSLVHVARTNETKSEAILRPVGSPAIRIVPEGKMREVLAEHCRFVKVTHGNGEVRKSPVHPPQWTTRALLARGEWRDIRYLEAVVEGPVIRSDGSILQEPGYDTKTGLLFIPSTDYGRVSDRPDAEQVSSALELLREVVCDFPFKGEEHFAAWLSALLTPLARFAFSGPSPLNLIDANTRGAGKSLLADVCNMIVTGRPAARMSYNARDQDELRKAVTSLAMTGDQIVLIDNIRGNLGDATLDRALTATTWRDRLLGTNTAIEVPLNVTWYATGNNVALSADTPRRCLHIRLESPDEHPERRTEFRHPRLLEWISEKRGRILPAALTLLRAFWVAGRPQKELSGYGSYESWSDVVRQCIVWLGLPDPAETRDELEETADAESVALVAFINGLEEVLDQPQHAGSATAAEILKTLEASPDLFGDLREALSELTPSVKQSGQLPSSKALGRLLRRLRGMWVDGASLRQGVKTRGGFTWKVCRADEDRRIFRTLDTASSENRSGDDTGEDFQAPDEKGAKNAECIFCNIRAFPTLYAEMGSDEDEGGEEGKKGSFLRKGCGKAQKVKKMHDPSEPDSDPSEESDPSESDPEDKPPF